MSKDVHSVRLCQRQLPCKCFCLYTFYEHLIGQKMVQGFFWHHYRCFQLDAHTHSFSHTVKCIHMKAGDRKVLGAKEILCVILFYQLIMY